jgi:hypothetical protein
VIASECSTLGCQMKINVKRQEESVQVKVGMFKKVDYKHFVTQFEIEFDEAERKTISDGRLDDMPIGRGGMQNMICIWEISKKHGKADGYNAEFYGDMIRDLASHDEKITLGSLDELKTAGRVVISSSDKDLENALAYEATVVKNLKRIKDKLASRAAELEALNQMPKTANRTFEL